MQVNLQQLARLRSSRMRSEAVGTIFEYLAMAFTEMGAAAAQITLDYQRDQDDVTDNDLTPFIILGLRPTTPKEEFNASGHRPSNATREDLPVSTTGQGNGPSVQRVD